MFKKAGLVFVVNVVDPIIDFVYNVCYWILHIKDIKWAIGEKKRCKSISTFNLMDKFFWRRESFDWTPWVITLVNTGFLDDCDGASALGKWAWKNEGIKSTVYSLIRDGGGHAVCVRDDHTQMISNSDIIDIDPDNWKYDVLTKTGTGKWYCEMIKHYIG